MVGASVTKFCATRTTSVVKFRRHECRPYQMKSLVPRHAADLAETNAVVGRGNPTYLTQARHPIWHRRDIWKPGIAVDLGKPRDSAGLLWARHKREKEAGGPAAPGGPPP
jgi:hypothetical protein